MCSLEKLVDPKAKIKIMFNVTVLAAVLRGSILQYIIWYYLSLALNCVRGQAKSF